MAKFNSAIVGKSRDKQISSPAGEVKLVTVVPWKLVPRGVKRQVISPAGSAITFKPKAERIKTTPLITALGLAFHWQRLLDMGRVTSITQLAEVEGVDKSHVSRLLKLTTLSPEIIRAIMTGKEKPSLDFFKKNSLPLLWESQRVVIGITRNLRSQIDL